VRILVPTEYKEIMPNYFDIMNFLLREEKNIMSLRDTTTRQVKMFAEIVGIKELQRLNFKTP